MPTFRTTLHQTGNNVCIVVPDDVVASFGAGKRVPVKVTIDGGYSYRTTISYTGSVSQRRVAATIAQLAS